MPRLELAQAIKRPGKPVAVVSMTVRDNPLPSEGAEPLRSSRVQESESGLHTHRKSLSQISLLTPAMPKGKPEADKSPPGHGDLKLPQIAPPNYTDKLVSMSDKLKTTHENIQAIKREREERGYEPDRPHGLLPATSDLHSAYSALQASPLLSFLASLQ